MILDGFLDTVRLLLVDEAVVDAFMREFAGTDVTFPKTRKGASFARLVQAVGAIAAERLCTHFAAEVHYVPRNRADELERRDHEIRARIAAGESAADIARHYVRLVPMTARHVKRIVNGNRGGKRRARVAELA